jgi:hypothetical protein
VLKQHKPVELLTEMHDFFAVDTEFLNIIGFSGRAGTASEPS